MDRRGEKTVRVSSHANRENGSLALLECTFFSHCRTHRRRAVDGGRGEGAHMHGTARHARRGRRGPRRAVNLSIGLLSWSRRSPYEGHRYPFRRIYYRSPWRGGRPAADHPIPSPWAWLGFNALWREIHSRAARPRLGYRPPPTSGDRLVLDQTWKAELPRVY